MPIHPQVGDDQHVTRRELYLVIQPLIDKQAELTTVMTDIGRDLKRMLLAAERHEGVLEEVTKATDRRRFWLMVIASLTSGCVVVAVAAVLHAL